MPLVPDAQFKGDPPETLEQFLAKWFALLYPYMNDEDRDEFLSDLKRSLRARERKMVALGRRKAVGL